jgi:hypothetical protein
MIFPSDLDSMIEVYGDPSPYEKPDGTIRPEWLKAIAGIVPLPIPVPLSWNKMKLVRSVQMHKLVIPSFLDVCTELQNRGIWFREWGGCYQWRPQAGSAHKLSTHCWAAAIDVDVSTNQRGTEGDLSEDLIAIFAKHGWFSGRRWRNPDGSVAKRTDPMHLQACAGTY